MSLKYYDMLYLPPLLASLVSIACIVESYTVHPDSGATSFTSGSCLQHSKAMKPVQI